MRCFPIRIRINLKRALFSIRNRWIPSPAENNDRAQISSGCWNDGCTKGSESGWVQGFGARLTKKIGKCVLKCVLKIIKAVDSNESTAFILVEVTGLEPAASWSQTTRATNCATPRCVCRGEPGSLIIIPAAGCVKHFGGFYVAGCFLFAVGCTIMDDGVK